MTTATGAPPVGTRPAPRGLPLTRLLRSERRKLTSTKTWWLFGIAILVTSGLTLAINIGGADSDFHSGAVTDDGTAVSLPPTADSVARHAANVFTSGQYFGALFVMLLAILMITNEYYHQTATSTFLATPRRTSVIVSKFVMAMLAAGSVWLVTTLIDLAGGAYFFSTQDVGNPLGTWTVQRAILVNLLMFALWGVFGIGLAALLRSQIGATVTAALLYTIGLYAAVVVFAVIRQFVYHHDVVWKAMVLVPAIAAQVAEGSSNLPMPDNQAPPPWWSGVIVMLAYGTIMAVVGTLILRKRDIS
jgi:ABC-type transport system involved in multi-copper enzyme maturation permease subunit